MSQLTKTVIEDSSVIAYEVISGNNSRQKRERRHRNGTSINIPQRDSGYIDTLQASYGFITCTDMDTRKPLDKRIFFHHTEYNEKFDDLKIGDYVEFYENSKNGRPVAVGVTKAAKKENWCLLPIIQQGEVIGLNKSISIGKRLALYTYLYNKTEIPDKELQLENEEQIEVDSKGQPIVRSVIEEVIQHMKKE